MTQARLYIHAFNFRSAWRELGNWPAILLAQLKAAGLAAGQVVLETPSGKDTRTSHEAAAEAMFGGKEGAYALRPTSKSDAAVEFYDYGTMLSATIDVPLPDCSSSSLLSLVKLATTLNFEMDKFGEIGPTFWLILEDIPYARPRPPRRSPRIGEGVWAYMFSRRHAESNQSRKSAFDKMANASLPAKLLREADGDLLVVRVVHGDENPSDLHDGLGVLETWMGETLDLPRDQDFMENGDQRWPVWKSERIKPFSFYDAAKHIAYKVVAEDAKQQLDPETIDELKEVLPLRELPDGRKIDGTMVVFVGREAALGQLAEMKRLGAAGTVYRDDNDFWNPLPPGNWIHANGEGK